MAIMVDQPPLPFSETGKRCILNTYTLISLQVTDLSDVPVYIQVTEDEGVPEYTVIVETLQVATLKSLFAAMCNYLAVFYVLNMAYEPLLKKTLQF